MSASKGSKRISVFDRLGPGTDEVSSKGTVLRVYAQLHNMQPIPSHRGRHSTEKHSSSSGAGSQEKGRGHAYGASVTHMEDRDTPPSRDRKTR